MSNPTSQKNTYKKPSIGLLKDRDIKGLFIYARENLLATQQYGYLSHLTYEDIVHMAFEKALSGDRRWNPDKCDIKLFYRGVIRSIISNSREVAKNQPEYSNTYDGEKHSSHFYRPPPEIPELLMSLEEIGRLLDLVKSEAPELLLLAETIIKENTLKPQTLADLLNTPVTTIYNKKKQLLCLCRDHFRGND